MTNLSSKLLFKTCLGTHSIAGNPDQSRRKKFRPAVIDAGRFRLERLPNRSMRQEWHDRRHLSRTLRRDLGPRSWHGRTSFPLGAGDQWKKLAQNPTPRFNLAGIVYGGSLMVVSSQENVGVQLFGLRVLPWKLLARVF